MNLTKYIADFKLEEVKKITEKEHIVTKVSSSLGVPVDLLHILNRKLKRPDEQLMGDFKLLKAMMTKLKAGRG